MWKSVLLKLHFIYLQITELYVFLSFEISFSLKKQVFESVLKPILGLFFYNFSQCSEALSQGHNGLRNAFVDEASLCESFEKKFLYTSKSYPNAVKLKVT